MCVCVCVCVCVHAHAQSLSHVKLFATLWTVACQTPLSMELSRQEYWSGLPFPPGILSNQGLNPHILYLLHWQADSLPLSHLGSPVIRFSSVQSLSRVRLCDPMNRSTPGLPVYHQLPESTQTHVHRVGDAIQPSQPLSSPSPPAPNPSQHQGLFQWVNSSHDVAKVLEFQLQRQSLQWTPRTDLL